jgi:hypothetical protein
LLEKWRSALDNKKAVATVLMDLSKAFDCLPHDLLIAKLQAYGMSNKATTLMASYLRSRVQRVKVGDTVSTWLGLIKGVPQGSVLGPVLFNFFVNDLLYAIKTADLINYADDNTLSAESGSLTNCLEILETEANNCLKWFTVNDMKANPDKFHFMVVGNTDTPDFNLGNTILKHEDSVELLGIGIDSKLNFNHHITNLCKKAARQLNVLQRISKQVCREIRLAIFRCFVLSQFNYCPLVWHFCGRVNTLKLEKLQYRGLKMVYRDYESSYEELCSRAGVRPLEETRLLSLATEAYKSVHHLSPPFIEDIF